MIYINYFFEIDGEWVVRLHIMMIIQSMEIKEKSPHYS